MTSNIWLWYYSVTKYFIIFFSSNKPTLFNNWSCFTFCIVSLFWSVWCIAESAPRRVDNKKCGKHSTISHNEESDPARSHIYNLSFLLNCETIFITFKNDDAYITKKSDSRSELPPKAQRSIRVVQYYSFVSQNL